MNASLKKLIGGIAFAMCTIGSAHATVYTEAFEATFPAWESDWFGTQSTGRNYYCNGTLGCVDRGNNPDGLWIVGTAGGSTAPVEVSFNAGFGASLTSFQLDIAGHTTTTLEAFDMANTLIFSQNVTLTFGTFTDPGTYSNYTINSGNGISRFTFSGNASGNTSIDNLVATTGGTQQVPEPASLALLGIGLAGLGAIRRRKQAS